MRTRGSWLRTLVRSLLSVAVAGSAIAILGPAAATADLVDTTERMAVLQADLDDELIEQVQCPPELPEMQLTATAAVDAEEAACEAVRLPEVGFNAPPAIYETCLPACISASKRWACKTGRDPDGFRWIPVANEPDGFALGNCRENNELVQPLNVNSKKKFEGGYVSGTYDGCGWMQTKNLVPAGVATGDPCTSPSPSRGYSTFASLINCRPYRVKRRGSGDDTCRDGTLTPNPQPCPRYANLRPWSTRTALDRLSGDIPQNAKFPGASGQLFDRLRWRYVVPGGQWVNVRDRAIPSGESNWIFVPRSCLPATLPDGRKVRHYAP
jgi:hypothetical protein